MKTVFEIPIALGYTKIIVDECCSIEHARTIAYQLSRENGNRKVRVTFPVDNEAVKKEYLTMLPYTLISAEPKTIKPKINKRLAVLVFMFTVLFIVLLFSLNEVNGQCAYSKNIVDDFTKEQIRELEPFTIIKNEKQTKKITFALMNVNGNKSVNVYIHRISTDIAESLCFDPNSSLSFLLKSGDVIKLNFINDLVCSESKIMHESIYGDYRIIATKWTTYNNTITVNFPIEAEQMKSLKTGVTKIRFKITDKELDFELAEQLHQYYFGIYDVCLN